MKETIILNEVKTTEVLTKLRRYCIAGATWKKKIERDHHELLVRY